MNVGDLAYEFILQQPTAGSQDPDAWTDVERVWASIRSIGMREQVRFGIPSAEGQSVVTIRYRTDVRANYRLVDQSVSPERSFQILGYSDPNGDLEQLDLLVVEKL
jgi:SPP1 family predicted phage head-tail adaptor